VTTWPLVGQLGAAEGPAVAYNWTAQGLVAPLLPWLAILAMLALKPNRGGSAWWIWLPLGGLLCGWHWAAASITAWPKDVLNVFLDVPRALAFAVAGLLLLAPYVGRGRRFRILLGAGFLMAAFGAFSLVVAGGWDAGAATRLMGLPGGGYPFAAVWAGGAAQSGLLTVMAFVIAMAMVLSGLVCSSRSFARVCLCFIGLLPAVLLAAAVVVHLLAPETSLDREGPLTALRAGLLISALSLCNLLPFLVLCAANRLFRERLKDLFHPRPHEGAPALARPQDQEQRTSNIQQP
jgi:hypothetical protein